MIGVNDARYTTLKNESIYSVLGLSVAMSLILVAVALHRWGAAEVRSNPGEVVFLTLAGGVWLAFASRLFPWLGLSFGDDVIERKNVATFVALCSGGGERVANHHR